MHFACVAQYARKDKFENLMFTVDEAYALINVYESYQGIQKNDTEVQRLQKMRNTSLPFIGKYFKFTFERSANEMYFTNCEPDPDKMSGHQLYLVLHITSGAYNGKKYVKAKAVYCCDNAEDQKKFMELVR